MYGAIISWSTTWLVVHHVLVSYLLTNFMSTRALSAAGLLLLCEPWPRLVRLLLVCFGWHLSLSLLWVHSINTKAATVVLISFSILIKYFRRRQLRKQNSTENSPMKKSRSALENYGYLKESPKTFVHCCTSHHLSGPTQSRS